MNRIKAVISKPEVIIKTKKGFNGIKQEDIKSMEVYYGNGVKMIVETSDKKYIFRLNDCIEIFICNEYLRTLNLKKPVEVTFNNYYEYGEMIQEIFENLIK